jgi:hypothetical protein
VAAVAAAAIQLVGVARAEKVVAEVEAITLDLVVIVLVIKLV